MLSENEFKDLIHQTTPILPEDFSKLKSYYSMLYYGNLYSDYIDGDFSIINNNYEQEMASLAIKKVLNNNEQSALDQYYKMHQQIEYIRQQEQEKLEQPLILNKKLENGIASRAGFTNASIIIFLVLFIGIILAIGLLIFA